MNDKPSTFIGTNHYFGVSQQITTFYRMLKTQIWLPRYSPIEFLESNVHKGPKTLNVQSPIF